MKKVLAGSLVGLTLSLGFVAPSFAAETNTNTLSEVKLQGVKEIERTVKVGKTRQLPYEAGYYYAIEPWGDASEAIDLTSKGVVTGRAPGEALVTIWEDGDLLYRCYITVE
ncbi:hypothetical protein [Aneurinibacillus aneurinilyticus]|jgi:hypothetical protein|uniref:hypothetical protein n=1 Tax=Aneurinibacillus aneurinilyticus TaxID=1391 RepID=UPI003524A6EA